MLTQICQYLRNWFSANEPKLVGTFVISADGVTFNGADITDYLKTGQYIRIIGSTFNDGVHLLSDGELTPETFTGAIWGMAIPPAVLEVAEEIKAWQEKYGGVNSENMSPFASESFGGYSYSKAQGYASTGGGMLTSWQALYDARLAPWRKI